MRFATLIMFGMLSNAGCGGSVPDADSVKKLMSADQLSLGEPITNNIGMTLVPIPAGEFQMGTAPPKPGKKADKSKPPEQSETPQHLVKITQPFYMSVCEVTQGQYEQITGERPWDGQPLVVAGENYAATYISWEAAAEFCKKLSESDGAEYRLPSEAEWEYACRAGTTSAFSFGDDGSQLGEYAWNDQNAYKAGEQYAHPVGQKLPNPWALYDMHGNVWEWCGDWYGGYDATQQVATDPTGPEKGRVRVWRGGGFAEAATNLRSAARLSYSRPDYRPDFTAGFRVVRVWQ